MTPTTDPLIQAETELRRLIAANRFDLAQPVLERYCRTVQERLAGLPEHGRAYSELVQSTSESMHALELMARASKAHLSSQLQQVSHLAVYGAPKQPARLRLFA